MNEPVRARQRLLRMALLGNAAFSVFSATIIVFERGRLAHWMGVPKNFEASFLFVGIGLIVFVIWLLLNAGQKQIKLAGARTVVVMDLVWVAASIPVVVMAPLAPQGKWVLTIIALTVLCFAIVQWAGIRRIRSESVQEEASHA